MTCPYCNGQKTLVPAYARFGPITLPPLKQPALPCDACEGTGEVSEERLEEYGAILRKECV